MIVLNGNTNDDANDDDKDHELRRSACVPLASCFQAAALATLTASACLLSTVLYSSILYTVHYTLYTIYYILHTIYYTLYYTILYYTILYYTIIYYTILYYRRSWSACVAELGACWASGWACKEGWARYCIKLV